MVPGTRAGGPLPLRLGGPGFDFQVHLVQWGRGREARGLPPRPLPSSWTGSTTPRAAGALGPGRDSESGVVLYSVVIRSIRSNM
jgi:hypothetical protein